MTASRTDAGAAMPARKLVRAWVTMPNGLPAVERILDVKYEWEAHKAMADEGLIPDGDYDFSVRRHVESSDAG